MSSNILDKQQKTEDLKLDLNLRPRSINEYVGQIKIKDNLEILLGAAKKRKESLEHILLYGASGLGKTTLAYIIAKEMGANIKVTSGPAIERVGDLGSILTNLADGDVLFVDEAHRLNKMIEEVLYPAMEDYKLDIVIGKGPSARTIQLDLPKFTLVAATTRAGLLSSPLRSRFGVVYHLDFYNSQEIENIILRSAGILGVDIKGEAAKIIALCGRSTPRVANRLLKRVRDFAQVKSDGIITADEVKQAFSMLGIDHRGLESGDRKILRTLIEKFNGGPAGVQALAAASNEEMDTIEDFYEPYLLQAGFLVRTPRGRMATKEAYKHLGFDYKEGGLV